MAVVNVRVENRKGFEQMFKAFRKAVTDRGVLHELKSHQFYEKPSEKRRKKIRQMEREKRKAASTKRKP
jgi:small subunit ribosomal protein S21